MPSDIIAAQSFCVASLFQIFCASAGNAETTPVNCVLALDICSSSVFLFGQAAAHWTKTAVRRRLLTVQLCSARLQLLLSIINFHPERRTASATLQPVSRLRVFRICNFFVGRTDQIVMPCLLPAALNRRLYSSDYRIRQFLIVFGITVQLRRTV